MASERVLLKTTDELKVAPKMISCLTSKPGEYFKVPEEAEFSWYETLFVNTFIRDIDDF